MKTKSAKAGDVPAEWWHIDADGIVLGRLAARVAAVLRGKHRPQFTPHAACGDFVVITNASKIKLTGNKLRDKMRYSHSGYPGHLKAENYGHFLSRAPEKVILKAVRGMLPHGVLGRQLGTRVKVYAGAEHPHAAQQPKPLEI
ncbi:50S ribosomal protein L13 [bacterium]|nr:50S ribosomal protein L13 [bacterium]